MVSTIVNFFHLLATVTWIGGMIYGYFVLTPSLAAIDPPQRGRLMGATAIRFSKLAWGSVIVLLITGFLRTPPGMLFSPSSTYGVTLLVKHLAVLAMIVIGLVITFSVAPRMESLAPGPGEKPSPGFFQVQKRLELLALVNVILGLIVLLLAASF